MHDFKVVLRLDTPLLQGGRNPGTVDAAGALRGSSVRGLMRHFGRALLGPLLNGDVAAVADAERHLFGAAGGAGTTDGGRKTGLPTFRVQDTSLHSLDWIDVPVRPGDSSKGTKQAYSDKQTAELHFRFRPAAIRRSSNSDAFRQAIWAVVWAAFALGSLGNRCRRGYGSLTLEDAGGIPDMPGDGALPTFEERPDGAATLLKLLRGGLATR